MCPITYKQAGVDIDEADRFIKKIKPLIRKTKRAEVLGDIGGFSGLFVPKLKGMKSPVIVSSTDGVGTKLLLAELLDKHNTVGIDLVAMCVDDVVVTGAEPLFFLDYIACGKLEKMKLYEIMKGIVKGCQLANCALVGGETAELPGMYEEGKYDLAGFCVGMVSKEKIIDGSACCPGDKVIGLASSGLHSNGFSLVRRVFSEEELHGPLGKALLRPTRIYAPFILKALKKIPIKAMAHITGGGFYDNIPRVIPDGVGVRIEKGSWPIPPIFKKIQRKGKIEEREMFRTLNMGVGMVLIVSASYSPKTISLFRNWGIKSWVIGELIKGKREVSI